MWVLQKRLKFTALGKSLSVSFRRDWFLLEEAFCLQIQFLKKCRMDEILIDSSVLPYTGVHLDWDAKLHPFNVPVTETNSISSCKLKQQRSFV